MAWITDTATDYRDMLDQLIEIATSDHVDTVAIVSGGTGYAVDEIITLTDGTRTHSATMRVTAVSSGVITGIQMEQNGAYTVDPDLTATTSHTSSGSGTGATFDLTMNSEPWTVERRAQEAVSATIADGGTGYAVNDKITLTMDGGGVQGATGHGTDYGVLPVFNVDTVSGGVITAVSLDTAGHIEEIPDVDGGTGGNQANVTGGTGNDDAVLTVTYQDVGSTQEDVVILSGPGEGGSDDIFVAIRTHQETDVSTFNTVFNWQLFGLTELNPALALHAQTDVSPGIEADIGDRSSGGGCYMVLKEDDSDPDITFWMSVTNRRIILICKVETGSTTFYPSMYLGLINGFGTTAELPYPLYVAGCCNRSNSYWGDTQLGRIGGISEPTGSTAFTTHGPSVFRIPQTGVWESFKNITANDVSSPSRQFVSDFTVYPTGRISITPDSNDIITNEAVSGVAMGDIYPTQGQSGVPPSPTYLWRPTPNTGDDIRTLVPLTLIATDDPGIDLYEIYGEMDNCYWISASDATTDLVSEDIQKIGDDRYMVFQAGNQTEPYNYWCIKVE